MNPRILVIDDEPQIHRFLGPALQAAGFEPLRAVTAQEGLRLAATQNPALVVLDLGLPDMDGQAVIPRLRAFSQVPIVILSARGLEEGKVQALDAGADDYVEKPFALAELLARMRAALRRAAAATGREAPVPVIRIGPLEVDLVRRVARLDGDAEALRLTPKEWDLLVALAQAGPGRVITHRQLLSAVWGPAHAEDAQYLRVYVGHLRQKLGEASPLIRTEPGVGYRFGEPA
ncbi:MAG: DNA-binding response regulator [Belnapia sp.]|jgi:two-component system KDP operon response regulator KdpE|nr:DNA-binding response regulator [Belnapia sp.]